MTLFEHRHVKVISHFSSASDLLSTFDALTSELGSNFSYFLLTPEHQLDTITTLAESVSERIKVIHQLDVDRISAMVGRENPVLMMPSHSIFMLWGLHSALDLLATTSDLDAVGGILFDDESRANTFGFVVHETANGNLELLTEIEILNTEWVKAGRESYARCLGPTPFCLLKPGHFHAEFIQQLSPVGMAISNASTIHQRRPIATAIFSGLVAFSKGSTIEPALSLGDIELLPANVYNAWVEQGLRHVNVLHRGFAVRDDTQKRIIHVGDPVIHAVDGVTLHNTSHPSGTLLSSSHIQQLGPAFSRVEHIIREATVAEHRLEDSLTRILVSRAVKVSRLIDAILPHRVRHYARKKLASLIL